MGNERSKTKRSLKVRSQNALYVVVSEPEELMISDP